MLLAQALCSVVIKEGEFRKRLTDLTLTFFFRNLTGRSQFVRIELEGIYDYTNKQWILIRTYSHTI